MKDHGSQFSATPVTFTTFTSTRNMKLTHMDRWCCNKMRYYWQIQRKHHLNMFLISSISELHDPSGPDDQGLYFPWYARRLWELWPWFQCRCYNRPNRTRRTSIHEYCNICCLLKCHHISLYHRNTFCFVLQFPNHMSSNILLTIRPIHFKYQFILQPKFLTNLIPSDIVKSAFKVPVVAFSGMKPWIRIASCVNERYEFNRGFV